MKWGLFAALPVAVMGCSIHQVVEPVATQEIRELCVKENATVHMSGFLNELVTQIETIGIRATVYQSDKPERCVYSLEYTANWRWDMAMYLSYANIRVYESDRLIGLAEYDARSGGGRPDKFGATANKINPLVKKLFGRT